MTILGGLALGALIAEEVTRNTVTGAKDNKSWDPMEGGYSGAKDLSERVTQYITKGGRPEYQNATSQPKTFSVYNNPYAKDETGWGTFEFYKTSKGDYTRDLSRVAGISMDKNGKVKVTIPDRWRDDSEVAKYADNYILKSLSGNYKKDKNIEYPDPYDENKKIKTQEYIELLNQGLKYRIRALDATRPIKDNLLKNLGGTSDKDKIINSLTTDDIITMSLQFDKDDSWVPLPEYMLEAYPQLKNLSSYSNGFVKKSDFLDNFYNIENGSITERYAYGIARTPNLMLQEVEDMSPEEVAKTIGFGRFIAMVDPKRSQISQFLQDMDAKARGFYGAIENWAYGTTDLVASVASLSLITGTKPDTKSFMEGLLGKEGTVSGDLATSMEQMALTNKDALTHAQRGYAEGMIAGKAVDTVVSMIVVGEAVKAVSKAVTTKIVEKGSSKIAGDLAGAAASASSEVATAAEIEAADAASLAQAKTLSASVQAKSAVYQNFFSQTLSQARNTYLTALHGTELALQGMSISQVVNAANSAAKVASLAQYANTAVNVLGSLTIAAIVGNKDLTTKVLSNKATSEETAIWIQSLLFDAAKYEAFGALTKVVSEEQWVGALKNSKFGSFAKKTGEAMSQKMMKIEKGFSTPWLKFRNWVMNNKIAAEYAKKVASNSRVAAEEAIKEAVLVNEAKSYGTTLSIVPGSTGTDIIADGLAASGTAQGVFDAEVLDWLGQNGVVFNASTEAISEFQNWKADYAEMQNALNNWGDISQNISQAVGEFTNPDIYPTISQNLKELKNANSSLLKEEEKAGMLSSGETKTNKTILSSDAGYIYSMHSPELSRYLVRNYEASVIKNEAKMKGVKPEEYKPYIAAKERLASAAEKVPENIRRIADRDYIPALKRTEREIVDVMISDRVYPKDFVESIRRSGKYGKDGADWMRLVAKKELPKGVYNPYSGTVKRDNTIALGSFKVLDDEDITWPGNGLQELIQEYGIARSEKRFLEASKRASGLTTDIVISGKETAAAGKMKEFRSNLAGAVRQGFNSFTEDVEGTMAIGKKRAIERKEFYEEIVVTGGIGSMDMDILRGVMKSNDLPMAQDIVDQPTLDKVYAESSDQGKKIITDTLGERVSLESVDESRWEESWEKFSPEVQKILRGELEKTSIDTGYGIKDTRARLNSQVPGFDVLDWSLLGREHVNGLAPEIGYANMDEYGTKAYIMDLEDLRSLTGLDKNKEDMSPDAIRKIKKDINTRDAIGAVLPLYYAPVSGQNKFFMMTRWGHSGDRFPDWETYFNYLEKEGIKKVPVALNYNKASLAHDALSWKFFEKLDKSIANGRKPKFTEEEIAVALRTLGTKGRVANRIRSAYPNYDVEELDKLLDKGEQHNISVSLGLKKDKLNIDFEKQLNEEISNLTAGKGINAKDITSDLSKAFSEYGQIPLYHNQAAPLGSVEPNAAERFPTTREGKLFDNGGAGDALWLAPNASYTDQYGANKVVSTIPVEYFLSDKAKNAEIMKIYKRLAKLEDKLHSVLESSDLEIKNDDELRNTTLSRLWDAEREGLAENLEDLYPGELKKAKDLLEKALTKKELKEYKELSNIFDINNISGNGIVEVGKHSIKSYRALAERLKKPVIDISRDGWADGTAYFYYKGVSPEFDKRLGEQLSIQAEAKPSGSNVWPQEVADKKFTQWAKKTSFGDLLRAVKEKYPESSKWSDAVLWLLKDGNQHIGSMQDFASIIYNIETAVKPDNPQVAHVLDVIGNKFLSDAITGNWGLDSSISDLGVTTKNFYNEYTAEGFLKGLGYGDGKILSKKQLKELETAREKWAAVDPQSFANVPTEVTFEQPDVITYEDYQRGISADAGLQDVVKNAVENAQFNKLQDLKENDVDAYELFLEKLDRANASSSPEVKQSNEAKIAADLYKESIDDLEKSTIFTDDFSYLAQPKAPKGTLKAFVEENNLELPDDKRPFKAKVKSALWKKVAAGEDLPKIKGVMKTDINKIRSVINDGATDAQIKQQKTEFYKILDETDLFKNSEGASTLKYDLDDDMFYSDIDDAIDGLIGIVTDDASAMAAINGIAEYQGVELSETRLEFIVLGEILSDEGKDLFSKTITAAAHHIVDGIVGRKQVIIKGNLDSLYKKVENIITNKLEARFAAAKTQLESVGEPANSETITQLLDKYREDIMDAKADSLVVKTTDENGEIQFERVSPTIADIYNNRPVYNPISTPKQILMNLALIKKISTTDLSPRSFTKQSVSDPAMAFATVGALPGTLSTMRDEIKYTFGQPMLSAIEKNDPIRYANIQAIAARDNIPMEEALAKNLKAKSEVQVPFTLLNQEILRRANTSQYGNQAAIDMARRGLMEKMNSGLRKVSDVLGTPQNKREAYFRVLAGEKAFMTALKDGYSQQQAEVFREYAINTATTNFRLKITVFNNLRSTVPYLTSGISGARSFWKMFELDPVGMSSRIFSGFILPIIFFMGEILSNRELREKYAALAESEKANHIVIPAGGGLILIPVGEELGKYVNIVTHSIETLFGTNKYDFWNLMLNDFVGLAPLDLTGFVDPDLLSQNPDFGEIVESGIGRVIAQTTPPLVQTWYIINTGKDPYTGKSLTNDYYSVDEDGNLVRMSYTASQFAKAVSNIIGGDARVIEKVTSGLIGPTFLHTLDTLTSAVDFAASGGQSGSLTTAFDKFLEDATKPFTAVGYDSMDKRFSSEISRLYRKKEEIEKSDEYIKYNTEISKEKDSGKRLKLINKRNDLMSDYKNMVEKMVKRYRDAGFTLDKTRFSKVVSLLVFEDALRADRQYMDLNTNYSDAYKQAMQTLYEMGIENPEGPSTLGYIYTDSNGKPQLKMYNPTQVQIVQNAFYGQQEIHRAHIEALFNDGTANSLKKKREAEIKAEQKYWDKYNSTGKLSNAEWDAIDDLRKAYNTEVVLALQDYMDTYGAANVLSSDEVMNFLVDDVIKVPSSEERVNGRYVSSGGGVLNKQEGFGPYYIKKIFGVVK